MSISNLEYTLSINTTKTIHAVFQDRLPLRCCEYFSLPASNTLKLRSLGLLSRNWFGVWWVRQILMLMSDDGVEKMAYDDVRLFSNIARHDITILFKSEIN